MFKKAIFSLLAISVLSFVCVIFVNQGASFNKYAPKLLRFEGEGYGIHKPIWGDKIFTKEEALKIHRHYYWNRYHGNDFKSQDVAEVLIDHLINAGEGKSKVNIKAFERIIGVNQDGYLSKEDVAIANEFTLPEEIVNPYVEHRLRYYRTRKDAKKYPGWFKRAKSFRMEESDETVIEDYIVPPKNYSLPPQKFKNDKGEMVVEEL
jgi:lysozyme family protein